jgi:phosphoribosylformimino-5-aminoimidazole carboxamide ribotide isomerase
MIVFPAIDIRAGKCVRLIEGDFNRETVFDANPVDAALRWEEAGATWIHLVDLDGAVAGRPMNLETIAAIRRAVGCSLQLGGGMRAEDNAGAAFEAGIDRVVLGTAAVRDRAFVARAAERWPDRIAVGLDARDGFVATCGWLDQTTVPALELAVELRAAGVQTFIFTDIRRDGTAKGPNLEWLRILSETLRTGVIASGGVGEPADIDALVEIGVDGVIVGRALYDHRVGLSDAIERSRQRAKL